MVQKPANDAFLKFFNENSRIFLSVFDEISLFFLPESICYDSFFFQYLFHLFPKSKLFQTLWFQVQNIKPKLKILGH